MTVYEAIHEMRRRSEAHRPFAFSYMSYSLQRGESHGEVEVEHAILYKNPKESKNDYQDWMLTYLDCSTREVHQLWQPLVMSFEHEPLTSID